MSKKIFFFDFDDTLRISSTNEVSKATRDALRQLQEQGHDVILNTGRSLKALDELVYSVNFDGYVCGCGTYIEYQGQVLYERVIESSYYDEIIKDLNQYHIEAIFEGHHGIYQSDDIQSPYMIGQVESIEIGRNTSIKPMHAEGFHFVKLSLHYPTEDVKVNFEHKYRHLFGFTTLSRDETEATLKNHSKATAMQFLLDKLNIKKEESFCFGDSLNDKEMLLAAGVSVLIGDKAKALCPLVTLVSKDAAHEGVYEALLALGLLKMKR